jgi:1,4-dihydroxy-2-naphthoate octaprenyltransferase
MSPYLLAARPKTLPAAVAPVLLASALAWRDGVFASFPAGVALAFALLIQVGTNYANDYFDFVKGADTPERVGPTRAVAAGLVTPRAMLRATAITFGLALAVGLLLVPAGGTWIILVGLLCVLMGLAYTGGPYPLAYNAWRTSSCSCSSVSSRSR